MSLQSTAFGRNASLHRRAVSHLGRRVLCRSFPSHIPSEFVNEIEEPAAIDMFRRMKKIDIEVDGIGRVSTTYVASHVGDRSSKNHPVFVLLHGFDSSLLEFRRFEPLLKEQGEVYAIDLAGWGFSDCGFSEEDSKISLGPIEKRKHLLSFIETVIARPVILVGASLGGATAIDFAVSHQELVEKLILIDAQGFIDGLGPMSKMPRALSVLGVRILRSVPLRQLANKMAYYDKDKFATEDAMKIGRLHTHLPGWAEANVAFMRSGGYSLSNRLGNVACPVLIAWGRNDEILDPEYASRFSDIIQNSQLTWIEECGHVPHLEQPKRLVEAVGDFVAKCTMEQEPYQQCDKAINYSK